MKDFDIVLVENTSTAPALYRRVEKAFVRTSPKRMGEVISNYADYTSERQQKELRKLEHAGRLLRIGIPSLITNTRHTPKIKTTAAEILFKILDVFSDPLWGCLFLANFFCGLAGESLRGAYPEFRAALAVKGDGTLLSEPFCRLTCALVDDIDIQIKLHSKFRSVFHRQVVLDFSSKLGQPDLGVRDFAWMNLKRSGKTVLTSAMPYANTTAVIYNTSRQQMQHVDASFSLASYVAINCEGKPRHAVSLRHPETVTWNAEALELVEESHKPIAKLLRAWSEWAHARPDWAKMVINQARAQCGGGTKRAMPLSVDGQKLTLAIFEEVLCYFVRWLAEYEAITQEQQEQRSSHIREVFHPSPVEAISVRRVDDPKTFLKIVRLILEQEHAQIAPSKKECQRTGVKLGAWCTISGEDYLVFDESNFFDCYKRVAIKELKLDRAFFTQGDWNRMVQKAVADAGLVKVSGSTFRYRYDLFGSGSKEGNYVVAIAKARIEASDLG